MLAFGSWFRRTLPKSEAFRGWVGGENRGNHGPALTLQCCPCYMPSFSFFFLLDCASDALCSFFSTASRKLDSAFERWQANTPYSLATRHTEVHYSGPALPFWYGFPQVSNVPFAL